MESSTTWTSGTNADDLRLSGLTPTQTQRVRDLARATLAHRGLEATVHAGHLRLVDGRGFGLENLASECHNAPEDEWPDLVGRFLGAMLDRFGETPPELTISQILEGAYLRLVPADAVTAMSEDALSKAYRYARDVGGGFLEVIAHRADGFARWLRDCEVEQIGVEELRALGRERLLALRPDICEEFRGADGRLYSIRGESSFIASKLLVLEQVLHQALPRRDRRWPHGALVAVPTKYELICTPVDRDVVSNLSGLMSLVPQFHRDGRGPLSPHIYWWRPDQDLQAITRFDAFGYYDMADVGEFVMVVDELLSNPDAA
jgi:hypothetical protein